MLVPDSILQLDLFGPLTPKQMRRLHFDGVERSYHTRGSRPTRSERVHGERKAREQEALVVAFFRANPGAWSPSQVHERVFGERVPLTSTRRAMTNLSDADRFLTPPLRKTELRVDGPFGRPEHLWRLA